MRDNKEIQSSTVPTLLVLPCKLFPFGLTTKKPNIIVYNIKNQDVSLTGDGGIPVYEEFNIGGLDDQWIIHRHLILHNDRISIFPSGKP